MPWLYRPNHPLANSNGMVDRRELELDTSIGLHVITDTMDPTRHMCDNQFYTSKSKFREVTKAHGCVEVGNEVDYMMRPRKPVKLDPAKRREDIRRTIYELRNGIRRP
jgi:hypothetical protein